MRDVRGSIFRENSRVVSLKTFPDEQRILRLKAPLCAAAAKPGQFVALNCAEHLTLPRPYSIMRADAEKGHIDIFFRRVGTGSAALSRLKANDKISSLGPIGNGFTIANNDDCPLLLGGGVGIPPILFLANALFNADGKTARVLLGSERPLPFHVRSSALKIAGWPQECDATLQFLEDKKIPARLCSRRRLRGYFAGTAVDAAKRLLTSLSAQELRRVALFACGPDAMLEAVAELASLYSLRCELCVEEFMACATGGCGGCAMPILENGALAMKRVCVDGPVFAAQTVLGGKRAALLQQDESFAAPFN